MSNEELKNKMDAELMKMHKEEPSKHITYLREKVIEKFGLKTVTIFNKEDWQLPKNIFRWGSRVGYDSMYYIKNED